MGSRAALRRPIDLYDVRKFDAGLGASLEKLASAHRAWAAAGPPSAALLVDGSPIEDLCLSFILPGAAHLLLPASIDVLVPVRVYDSLTFTLLLGHTQCSGKGGV